MAQAFLIGADFIADEPSCLILGDNIFYGHDFHQLLGSAMNQESGASVFAYHVIDNNWRRSRANCRFDGINISLQLQLQIHYTIITERGDSYSSFGI